MFLLDSILDRICGFNAWNRRTQNIFKAFYALNATNSRKQYVHSILLHFSLYFIPYRECKDSDFERYFQRFCALIFRQLGYILKYINFCVVRTIIISTLFVQLRASAFIFVFNHLIHLWIRRDNIVLKSLFKSNSSSVRHQASVFKVHTSIQIQLSPVAFRAARRKALNQSAIWQAFVSGVYPAEAQSLFHNFDVWNGRPFGVFATIGHYPTTLLLAMVISKPLPKLGAVLKME